MGTLSLVFAWGVVCSLQGFTDTLTEELTPLNQQSEVCPQDPDERQEQIEWCMKKAERFLHRYLKHSLNIGSKHFILCSELVRLESCLQPLLLQCPAAKAEVHPDWFNIYHFLSCQCSPAADCGGELGCFESQFGGILSDRCDEYYKFNVRQQTRHKCDFLYGNVHCKEALVKSACGQDAGILAFHMAKMYARRPLKQAACHLQRNNTYHGFQYSGSCTPDFTDRLAYCYRTHLKQDRLSFHQGNDLVAHANTHQLELACRNYNKYKSCEGKIEEACPTGVALLYEYNDRLRVYLFKMNVICQQHYQEYAMELPCFGDVLANQTMQQCAPLWQKLEPQLKRISAFQFFCRRDSNTSQAVNRDLDSLRSCYESVFSASCPGGMPVMTSLIRGAFRDPFYLQFKFHPDCDLHTQPTRHKPHRKQSVKPGQEKGDVSDRRVTTGQLEVQDHQEDEELEDVPVPSTGPSHAHYAVCGLVIILSWVLSGQG